jgi:hypothetical protein|tara:strand:- start:10127 stop:10420 length:294 start_codon:yes stop_codon:yes gene_type:complete
MELVKNYAYEGKVVKLTKNNLEQWRKTFKNIPNLEAVLMARDTWLTQEADDKARSKWYISTVHYLVKVDAKFANENKQDESGRKVDSTGNPIFKRMP